MSQEKEKPEINLGENIKYETRGTLPGAPPFFTEDSNIGIINWGAAEMSGLAELRGYRNTHTHKYNNGFMDLL